MLKSGKITRLIIALLALALAAPILPQEHERRIYLCRSPLLAFNFWNSLQNLIKQGVTLTPQIAQQICDHMKAGTDPQCIYVEMAQFKPIATGWQGAMALTDGKTKVWFHNPDTGGWVSPDYYIYLMNAEH